MKRILKLSFGLYANGGRSKGKISAPRHGSLIKRIYRFLDTNRVIFAGNEAKILLKYIYDPNRTGRITLIMYNNAILCYILAANYNLAQETVSNLTRQNEKFFGWSNYLKLLL